MKRELQTTAFVILSMAFLGFGINFAKYKQGGPQQQKSTTYSSSRDARRDAESELQRRTYKLFTNKIVGNYLYDPKATENEKAKRTKKLIPVNRRISDKNYQSVLNYSMFSSKKGDADAELFWNLVKDVLAQPVIKQWNPLDTTSVKTYYLTVDTVKTSFVNEDKDTIATTIIFGGNKYIDLKNKYVAKYIDEIKQICAEARRIEAVKARMNKLEQEKQDKNKEMNIKVR